MEKLTLDEFMRMVDEAGNNSIMIIHLDLMEVTRDELNLMCEQAEDILSGEHGKEIIIKAITAPEGNVDEDNPNALLVYIFDGETIVCC